LSNFFNADIVLRAYRDGYFPMADDRYGEIYWHSPDPRAIFPLSEIKFSRKIQKAIAKHNFTYTINTHFADVIKLCAERETTWINDEIIDIYSELHYDGFAHSVEVYENEKMVGGLYGIAINAAFFGESMFNTVPDASKAAFYYLIDYLRQRGFILLDSQYINPFTSQLGAIEIRRNKYLYILQKAIEMNVSFV
jgi:leucyl/phenylalanyl-tRNA--protein transferase